MFKAHHKWAAQLPTLTTPNFWLFSEHILHGYVFVYLHMLFPLMECPSTHPLHFPLCRVHERNVHDLAQAFSSWNLLCHP